MKALTKPARRKRMSDPTTSWQTYTPVRALNPSLPASKENPPVGVRGFVADYDVVSPIEVITLQASQIAEPFQPTFYEVTLSGKGRFIWVFEQELPVAGAPFLDRLWRELARRGHWEHAIAGFDANSFKPAERWTSGGVFYEMTGEPMNQQLVVGAAMEAGRMMSSARAAIPIERIAEEVQARFPGRWAGAFEAEAVGVRFWDPTADAGGGAQVKPDGMLCFTGPVPFMPWAEIFGRAWVDEQSLLNLAAATENLWYDGRNYWHWFGDQWLSSQENTVERILAKAGLDPTRQKHQRLSDVSNAILHIQTANRIDGAGPFITSPPGILKYRGGKFLNIARLDPTRPAGLSPSAANFPWIWRYLEGLFHPPENGSTQPLDHFLAWLKRAHLSISEYRGDMGQILFFSGPKNTGKTLLSLRIITPLLGNRQANPYAYMVGDSAFTDDLFSSPVWCINDEDAPRNDGQRHKFIARLKSTAVNPEHTYHPKFCQKLMVSWQGRMVVTLNDDPASVSILPEVSDNTADKMMFFRVVRPDIIFPSNRVLEDVIESELPHFADFLRAWEIPDDIVEDTRMGVRSYFDESLLSTARHQNPSHNLLELLQTWQKVGEYWREKDRWEGTITELMSILQRCDPIAKICDEWTVGTVAKKLTDLAKIPSTGVGHLEGRDREFYIDRTHEQAPQ